MKRYIVFLIVSVFTCMRIAASTPIAISGPGVGVTGIGINPDLSKLKARDIEKMIGRRLTIKEKITWMLMRHRFKKAKSSRPDVDIAKKARKAKTFGILSLISLFVPLLGLAAIPFAIVAIVMGSDVKKVDPGNRDARTAITLGIVTLAVFVAIIFLVVAVISALTFT
jgi:hypothetical protein